MGPTVITEVTEGRQAVGGQVVGGKAFGGQAVGGQAVCGQAVVCQAVGGDPETVMGPEQIPLIRIQRKESGPSRTASLAKQERVEEEEEEDASRWEEAGGQNLHS